MADRWFGPALILTLAITALRLVALALNRTDLFLDESQYWLWSRDLALGYYSKPPLIAWAIRAATELGGDGTFWVRLPTLVCHAATAMLVGAITATLGHPRRAVLMVAAYLTLPMVALGSLLINTDTIMFPFLAAALLAYLACLRGSGATVALLGGLALGLGFLAKYAAVYFLLCAVLAAGLRPRLTPAQALGFLIGFAAAAAPNVVWNLTHGLATVQHTLDNANWVRDPGTRAGLHPLELAQFLILQLGFFGPILFPALLVMAAQYNRHPPPQRRLLLFSIPILALVSAQALISYAYGNWAAPAYLAGMLAVILWLARVSRPWLRCSVAANNVCCLHHPALTAIPAMTRSTTIPPAAIKPPRPEPAGWTWRSERAGSSAGSLRVGSVWGGRMCGRSS